MRYLIPTLVCGAVVLVAPWALAQDGGEFVIDTSSWLGELVDAVAAVLIGVITVASPFLIRRVMRWMGIKETAETQRAAEMIRAYVDRALFAGVQLAVAEAKRAGDNLDDIVIRNRIAAQVARYASDTVRDGLVDLGLYDPSNPEGERFVKLQEVVKTRMEMVLAGSEAVGLPPAEPDDDDTVH